MKAIRFFAPLLLAFALLLGACSAPTTVPVTDVTLSQAELTLTVGETATLTATVAPTDATNKAVSFASSNAGVVTVDASGKVTAVATGTATVTVTTADGAKTAACTVNVVETPPTAVIESAHYSFTVPMMSYLTYTNYYSFLNTYASTGYMSYISGPGGKGLDPSKPLRAQNYSVTEEKTVTWFDHFAELATDTAKEILVLCEAATANGIALGEYEQETIDMSMQMLPIYVSSAGYATTADYLSARYGDTVTEGDMRTVLELSQLATKQSETKTAEIESAATSAHLEEYYEANKDSFDIYADFISYTYTATYEPTGDAAADAAAFSRYTDEKEKYAARTAALALCTTEEEFCALLTQYCKQDGMTDLEALAAANGAVHVSYDITSDNTDLENWLRRSDSGSTKVLTEIWDDGTDTMAGEAHYTVCYLITPPHRDETKLQHVGHILFQNSTFTGLTNADTLTGETKALAERLLARGEALTAENMAKELVTLMQENGDLTQATNAAGNTIYTMEKSAFEAYGNTYTEDGSVFYNDVKRGYMVEEFDAWLYDPARAVDEISLTAVKTTYGYHIMYYGGEGETENWAIIAFEKVTAADYEAWYAACAATHALTLQLENIALITP